MIELARHIEILLLKSDCVIIPNLGGFIAHYQPARYIEEENLYLPPIRTIGFNPQLTINDGLLAQAYMQAHHTDFPDATRMIEKEVAELKDILYENGSVEIHGVGVLHYNIHNMYEFHPNESGVMTPSLYGLSPFCINRLDQAVSSASATRELLSKQQKEIRKIHISRQWISSAAAVVAAIVLFFLSSVPVENTYIDKGNYASLGTNGLFEAIRSQSLATTLITIPSQQDVRKNSESTNIKNNQNTLKPTVVKVEKVAKAENSTSNISSAKTVEELEVKADIASVPDEKPSTTLVPSSAKPATASTTTQTNYHIIVASLATSNDAQRALEDYKKKGYNEASVVEGNGHFRLSLCGFVDKASAYNKLNELKQEEAFKNAWVLGSNK